MDSLDETAKQSQLFNLVLEAVRCYEYVHSSSNWSDEISRQGVLGPWEASRGFKIGSYEVSMFRKLLFS